jgi:2-haloacid dehalogenase
MTTVPDVREKDKWWAGKPSVLIFDVTETLIDFESMNPLFERVFGDKRVMREWLGHLIMYSMTIPCPACIRIIGRLAAVAFRWSARSTA